jgi:hypothetical protein
VIVQPIILINGPVDAKLAEQLRTAWRESVAMTEFDPVKAAAEELAGLVDVHKVLITRSRETERQLAEIEAEHNAMVKMERFTADLVDKQRARHQRLVDEAERAAGDNTK